MPDGLHPLNCTPKLQEKKRVSVSQKIEFVSFFVLQQTVYTRELRRLKCINYLESC